MISLSSQFVFPKYSYIWGVARSSDLTIMIGMLTDSLKELSTGTNPIHVQYCINYKKIDVSGNKSMVEYLDKLPHRFL